MMFKIIKNKYQYLKKSFFYFLLKKNENNFVRKIIYGKKYAIGDL